jgi:polyferredoxin
MHKLSGILMLTQLVIWKLPTVVMLEDVDGDEVEVVSQDSRANQIVNELTGDFISMVEIQSQ